ncbi:hypothetical protein HY571_02090 [Candidatus Micrarchaeota archaeon]|nr:hypothetical protein [Candidatus Micrarchaeota archaeon]
MAEEFEEDKFSRVRSVFKPLTDAVNKIGLARIILFIIVLGVAWWFVSLPKPGNLLVTVTELDGTQRVAGALVSLQWPDGRIIGDAFTTVTDSSGVASFTNVPTEKELAIVIEGIGEYSSTHIETRLASGQSRSEEAQLPKNIRATLSPGSIAGSVSETCVKQSLVTITNNGEGELQGIFIGEGSLQTAVSSEPTTIFPGTSENVSVFIDVSKTNKRKGERLTGEIRLKGTRKSTRLNFQVGEAPRVDVNPASLSCQLNRGECQQIVTIKNSGDSSLSNLRISVSPSIVSILQDGDVERFYTSDSIAPGAEAKFGVRIIAASTAIGVISVTADCFSRQIDVQTG